MMHNLSRSIDFVLHHEGGLSQDPRDTGGITNFGISIRFAGSIQFDIDGDGKTTPYDIKALTRTHAVNIYRTHFWDTLYCDLLPAGVDLLAFDGAVNQGVGRITRLLQRATGLKDDGVAGPVTRAAFLALQQAPARHRAVLIELAYRRAKKYAEAPTVGVHGNGWYRRLFEAYTLSLTL